MMHPDELRNVRVVHLIPSLEVGGVEKAIMLSMEEIRGLVDYRVLSLTKPAFALQRRQREIVNFPAGTFPCTFFRSLRLLWRMRPGILVCSLWKSVPLAAVYKLFHPRIPLIGFFHSTKRFHLADRLLLRLLVAVSDYIAADSEATLQVIARHAGKKSVFKIPFIFPGAENAREAEKKIPRADFVFTGRIVPVKNLPAAFRFLKILAERGLDPSLEIYGSGDHTYITEMQAAVAELGLKDRVKFRGSFPPEETSTILGRHSFLLQLSDAEGMAMSVVDAMLHGVVPVVTAVGEIPSYLEHMKNGIVVEQSGEKALEKAAESVAILCRSAELYQKIRHQCLHSFDGKPGYVEAYKLMLKAVTVSQ